MKSILTYIKEAKNNKNKLINHKYKDDEVKSALWDYVAGFTSTVNDDLRSGKKWDEVTKYLDKAFTSKQKLDVYRTVNWDYMKNIYGITQKNIQEKIGTILHNKGYMSTTSIFKSPWGNKWQNNELVMHIVSNNQYPCIDVNKVFSKTEIDCYDQNEILLPRDTELELISYEIKHGKQFYKDGGTYLLEMEIKN